MSGLNMDRIIDIVSDITGYEPEQFTVNDKMIQMILRKAMQ